MRRRRRTSSPPPPSPVGGSRVDGPRRGARCRATSRFVDVLEQMGATVERGDDGHRGARRRRRSTASTPTCADLSDTAPDARRRRGVRRGSDDGHRHRLHPPQGDRPHRPRWSPSCGGCGIEAAEEHATGSPSTPARPRRRTIRTYDDHRMAMAFALLGLRATGHRDRRPGLRGQDVPGATSTLAATGDSV